MMRLVVRNTVIALALALVLVAAGCSKNESGQAEAVQGEAGQRGEGIQDLTVAVTVNGQVVTNQDVSDELAVMMQQLSGRVDPQRLDMMRDAMRQQALDTLINRILLDQATEKEGIKAAQEEIDERMKRVRDDFDSDQAFNDWLRSMGIDEGRLAKEMESALKVEKLLDRRGTDLTQPTESEIRAFYDENPGQFTQAEQVRASHILLKVDPADTDEQKQLRREEAQGILEEIRKGADFADLASRHSDCPSKERGGDLGFFERGRMVKPFEDAAFALETDQLSDIVQTRFGYHIIKVTDRQAGRTIPYEEAKDDIANYLSGQRKQEALKALTQELRDEAAIVFAEADTSSG